VNKQGHFFYFILVLKIRPGRMNRFSSPVNHKNRALFERPRFRASPGHGRQWVF
jgi:hypothetical protein